MTQAEFKAWFEGFTEALEGVPNKAQWKRIKERIAEIDGKPITERVFIDRYWPQYIYQPWFYNRNNPSYWPTVICGQNQAQGTYSSNIGATGTQTAFYNATTLGENFSSANAMYALGKSDAISDIP